MNELELKTRLEKAVHRPIPWPEWNHLVRMELAGEYDRGALDWREFRDLAEAELKRLWLFHQDKKREESGVASPEVETDADRQKHEGVASDDVSLGSRRTAARSNALESLDRLRAPSLAWQRGRIRRTAKPRGGVDGTTPQWVIFMGVEAWVPAEEVKEAYQELQRDLLAEQRPPKTSARAFQVADFVWQQQRIYGERPPWPVLLERWNELFRDQRFDHWRDLRRNFVRGGQATPPRYLASEDQIIEEVKSRDHAHMFDMWASSFRE